jgi:hypothetical protein
MRVARTAWLAAVGAGVLAIGVVQPSAHASEPGFSGPTVVLDTLAHPRGIKALADGVVLVTESGREGTTPCLPDSPGSGRLPQCLSQTGSVSIVLGTHKVPIATGLSSIGSPDGRIATGPSDVVLSRQGLVIIMGLANNPTQRALLGPGGVQLGQLLRHTSAGWTPFADLSGYEEAHNPDGLPNFDGLWSHPFAAILDGDSYVVVDAGANTLYRVSFSGAISIIAVFPNRDISGASVQPVPTSVLKGRDGSYYVSELTGYPYTGKVARVWRVVPGQAPQIVAQGLDPIMDMDFDNHGRLHVLEVEYRGSPFTNPPPAGRVTRIEPDGTAVPVITGLTMPTSLSFTLSGSLYVADNSVSLTGGKLVKFTRTG